MPSISVILPCYNVSRWIDRCLQSLADQTIGVENLELICVDDCSTDDTAEKIAAWEQKYPEQILLIKSDTNRRIGGARNIGMQYATAEWIAYIDSDDWVEPMYMEKLYQKATTGKYDVICCWNVRDTATDLHLLSPEELLTGKADREIFVCSDEDRKQMIHAQPMKLSAWTKLIRRAFLEENEIGFVEGLAYEDIIWGELMHLCVNSTYILEERLYHYFVNTESTVMSKSADYQPDMLTVQSLLYREWDRRGALAKYHDEVEFEFIYSCLLAFVKLLALRFETPPYSLFRLLQIFAQEHFPDYLNNYYFVKEDTPELHRQIAQAVSLPLTKKQFLEFAENVKTIGL
ncbi:MAG: glycosyltransferase family 2 protein [Lachnospiraceae bacterium]|nr:glycosyltransferase family 2 protein [Lachnospiraceae bacterium]